MSWDSLSFKTFMKDSLNSLSALVLVSLNSLSTVVRSFERASVAIYFYL